MNTVEPPAWWNASERRSTGQSCTYQYQQQCPALCWCYCTIEISPGLRVSVFVQVSVIGISSGNEVSYCANFQGYGRPFSETAPPAFRFFICCHASATLGVRALLSCSPLGSTVHRRLRSVSLRDLVEKEGGGLCRQCWTPNLLCFQPTSKHATTPTSHCQYLCAVSYWSHLPFE